MEQNKYLFYPFTGSQYCDDNNSFYYSIINSCVYKQLPIPLLINLKQNDNKDDVITSVGLNMKNGNNIKELFKNGGIITINHPLININHSFLMIKDDNNKYVLINSWFGPTILIDVEKEIIEKVFDIKEGFYFSS